MVKILPKRFVPLLIMLGFLAIFIITPFVAAVFGIPIIAMDDIYISIASYDFYTLAHLLWGVALFVVIFTIGFIAKNRSDDPLAPISPPDFKKFVIYWVITLAIAGIWEIIENTLLIFVGMKVEFDSVPNIITDITIWGIGGLMSWYMTDLMFLSKKFIRAYYIYGILNLLSGALLFILFSFITTNF
ncbi:MAG: hypothetical protein JSV62_04950 [Promethearchaeota archaeon]|nr:MAG: hypothetical protein JSV62_04950 [Candidatus Lokiarchaeota archaeon]